MLDLRTFLESAKRAGAEGFLEIKERHDIKFEVCALLAELEKEHRAPVLLFSDLNTLDGGRSPFPLLTNTFASREACALALGLPAEKSGLDLVLEFQRREAERMKPCIIGREDAPVKEVVAQPNLHALPILTHHLEDKGPYLTMSWSARDLESGVYNSSFHRCYVRDERHLVMFFERRHLWEYYLRAERRDEPLPVACVIGHHPSYYLGNCVLAGIEVDEYESIGGIMGEPLRLVPSESFGERLLVPADAEMVIEGECYPGDRKQEGPLGEWTGYYASGVRDEPVMRIRRVYFRNDPIMTGAPPSRPPTRRRRQSMGSSWSRSSPTPTACRRRSHRPQRPKRPAKLRARRDS